MKNIFFISLFLFSSARAASFKPLFFAGGDFGTVNTTADRVAGATYTTRYVNPLVAHAGFGIAIKEWFYLGTRYEYWFSKRVLTLDEATVTDTLNYQTLSGESGFRLGNHRLRFLFLGGVQYPLVLNIASATEAATTSYTDPSLSLTYYGRIVMDVRFSPFHGFYGEVGYRFANLGTLTSGESAYIDSDVSEDFNLSGLYVGAGISLTL